MKRVEVGQNHYYAIYNEILYFLFFISKYWSSLSEIRKNEEECYICKSIRLHQKKNSKIWSNEGECVNILREIMKYVNLLSGEERENIISFLSETKMLSVFTRPLYCMGKKSIDNVLVRQFLDNILDKQKKFTIICSIYGVCNIEARDYLKEFIKNYYTCLNYENAIYGMHSGAIKYDEKVEQLFLKKIRMGSHELLSINNEDNPVYVLSYLYSYRLIGRRQIEKYKEFVDKSLLLLLLIYPMYFSWDLFCEEWNHILSCKEYRKYREDIV